MINPITFLSKFTNQALKKQRLKLANKESKEIIFLIQKRDGNLEKRDKFKLKLTLIINISSQ